MTRYFPHICSRLKLALDLKAMRDAGGNFTLKQDIYENGQNALPYTLRDISTTAATRWSGTPMYDLYRYAFTELGADQEHDTKGNFDGSPATEFAHQLVLDLLTLQVPRIEAEGVVVFSVLMAFWSELFDMLKLCGRLKDGEIVDNAELRLQGFLDQAAALWVGAEQEKSSSSTGFMLYNLAQNAGEQFNQIQDSGETLINELVFEMFLGLQSKISKGSCAQYQGYKSIRNQVKLLVTYSNTVLVQMLIHRIEEDNARKADFAEMYTLALLPQLSVCDRGAYDNLLGEVVATSISDDSKIKIIESLQSAYRCFNIDCKLVGAYDGDRLPQCDDSGVPSLVDYQPVKDVREKSFVDRDIAMIRIFLELASFDSVKDFFAFGWNSDVSLQDIVDNEDNDVFDDYDLYYDDEMFPDELIVSALNRQAPFDSASDNEIAALVHGVIQGTVMYWAVVQELESASDSCDLDDVEEAIESWDTAAAYFVGSIEGSDRQHEEGGELLFAMTNRFCTSFATCQSEESAAGKAIMTSLKTGLSLLQSGTDECPKVQALVDNDIVPKLLVPLVQGMVSMASKAADGDTVSSASLFALSRPVVPELSEVSATNAEIIERNSNFFYNQELTLDYNELRGAIVNALDKIGICRNIGEFGREGYRQGFCVGDTPVLEQTPAPVSSPVDSPSDIDTLSPTSRPVVERPPVVIPEVHPGGIAWGRYEFDDESVAENDANFALDVKSMNDAVSPDAAERIYNSTSENVPLGASLQTGFFSLRDMSVDAATYMSEDRLYNIYRLALFGDASFDNLIEADGWTYGDQVVRLALGAENGHDQHLGSKAAVVLNVWMFVAHRLQKAVKECKAGKQPTEYIDSAVSLWIGAEQGQSIFNSGWMMYSIAQEAHEFLGNVESESPVNTAIIDLFNEAQDSADLCAIDNEQSFLTLRFLAKKIETTMTIPLLQNLLYYIATDNFKYVELFAIAVIPQAMGCNKGTYTALENALYKHFDREATLADASFMRELVSMLTCLDVTCSDLGNFEGGPSSVRDLFTNVCRQLETAATFIQMAGYNITEEIGRLDRIDLDVQQMELFMKAGAYSTAADIYTHGWNSLIDHLTGYTLQQLALGFEGLAPADLLSLYDNYYGSKRFADNMIESAVEPGDDSVFFGASRVQIAEVPFRVSQTTITLLVLLGRLENAIAQCMDGKGGQKQVDQAVSLYVGSMEGRNSGGDANNHGKFLYAFAKSMCEPFNTCQGYGDAASNELIMFSFADMKEQLDEQNCDEARSILKETVTPLLRLPLIQGILYYANVNQALPPQARNASVTAGYIVTESLLPLLHNINSTSADIVRRNMAYTNGEALVMDGFAAVQVAVESVLDGLGIACNDVGQLGSVSFCPGTGESDDIDEPTSPERPTNLGNDLYTTTRDVQDLANIAVDVKDMTEELALGNSETALRLYEKGKNSIVYDQLGNMVGKRTLAGYSLNATRTNPLYTVAVYALQDEDKLFLGRDAWWYADTIVRHSISAWTGETVAAEAAVVLNVWMGLATDLFNIASRCRKNRIKGDDGLRLVDGVVAYWIGDGQVVGDSSKGHLLYAMAELMGEKFQSELAGQARLNTNILGLLNEAKIAVSLPDACAVPSTVRRVRHLVNKIVSQMIGVSIQGLIDSVLTGDKNRAFVYAHAVVPLVSACNPRTFAFLKDRLLNGPFEESAAADIVQAIRSTLPCFSLLCEDIGQHETEQQLMCTNIQVTTPMAGYTPKTDVRELMRLDLDILEMEILLEMNAIDAASELYELGKHVPSEDENSQTSLSLQTLARQSSQSKSAYVELHKRYFSNDYYADKLINGVLNDQGVKSTLERRTVVGGLCRYMVLLSVIADNMNSVVEVCEGTSGEISETLGYWDKMAALALGYLEGEAEGGSNDGMLLWGLAKQNCVEFGTCTGLNSALVNDEIVTLLYAGRGEIISGNCGELRKTTGKLLPLFQTPLIQGALSSATELDSVSLPDIGVRARGYVYATTLLPAIYDVNRDAATTIASNFRLDKPTLKDGLDEVAHAFTESLGGMNANCEYVGKSARIDSCTGDVKRSVKPLIVLSSIILSLVGCFALGFLCYRWQFVTSTQEEKAEFLPSDGELNHASDVVPEQSRESLAQSDSERKTGDNVLMSTQEPENENGGIV